MSDFNFIRFNTKRNCSNLVFRATLSIIVIFTFLLHGSPQNLMGDELFDHEKFVNEKGALQPLNKQLKEMVPLLWNQGELKAGFEKDSEKVKTLYNAMRASVGGGSASYSSGGERYRYSFTATKATGLITRGYNNDNNFEITLSELVSPMRSMKLVETKEGGVNLMITSTEFPYMFRFKQTADGRVVVQELAGLEIFSANELSFAHFCSKHSDFLRNRFVPALKSVGLEPPATPYGESVQTEVLRLLSPPDASSLAEFKAVVENLDSSEYKIREETQKLLTKKFSEYQDLFPRLISESSLSPEIRSRLGKIMKSESKAEDLVVSDVVRQTRLLEDPRYLVWLLNQRKPEERGKIVDKLNELTKQELTADLDQWNEWASERYAAVPVEYDEEPKFDFLSQKGMLDNVADHTRKLVQFKTQGDHLIFDKSHWKELFGGLTTKEASDEILEVMKKHNFPASWFNSVADGQENTAGYAQVLFTGMQASLTNTTRRVGNIYLQAHTANRTFTVGGLKADLKTQSNEQRGRGNNNPPDQFKLILEETTGPMRTLTVYVDKSKRVRLSLVNMEADSIIQLIELQKESWVLHDVRGTSLNAINGSSFAELYKNNPQYFDEEFFPIMEKLGVGFQPSE